MRRCRCRRPYHVGNTGSRLITEVKQRWARLVLAWVTGWEYRVLPTFANPLSTTPLSLLLLLLFWPSATAILSHYYCPSFCWTVATPRHLPTTLFSNQSATSSNPLLYNPARLGLLSITSLLPPPALHPVDAEKSDTLSLSLACRR